MDSNAIENHQEKKVKINMIPTFTQCRPIVDYNEIEECLDNPPEWVERVVPLHKRSGVVLENKCHFSEENYSVQRRIDCRNVPKTLVCHDYKGGYLEDSYVPFKGEEDKTMSTDGYTFYHWSQIDYFVYFSHHFITIPPLAWTNAAHKNGVKILGTLITENKEGVQICDEQIFNSENNMREFVFQLNEIQKIFGFDGWLLNIENPVAKPEILKKFVETLTRESHLQDEESVIIWYDSVTREGKLKWQDQLNEENRCFFDNCDGIFLNYSWNEEKLRETKRNAALRNHDVFVGIDVFGRNMFGGGEFNTNKAAELARSLDLSIALFATGWTHETMKNPSFANFMNRDDTFWFSLLPHLYTHPIQRFFTTNFHIGLDNQYYNLYAQNTQLSMPLYPQDHIENPEKYQFLENCFCLKRAFFENKPILSLHYRSRSVHSLFQCDFQLTGKIGVYLLLNKFKSTSMDVTLITCLKSGSLRQIRLLGTHKTLTNDDISMHEVNRLDGELIKYNSTFNDIANRLQWLLLKPEHRETLDLSFYEFSTTKCDLMEIVASIRNGVSVDLVEFGIVQLN